MASSIVNLMLKTEYDTIDDIDSELFASFLAERISENKFPIDRDRIYKEVRTYIKKRHQSNSAYYGGYWDENGYQEGSLPPKFNFSNFKKNNDSGNYAFEEIEDDIIKDILKSISYDDVEVEFRAVVINSIQFPYITKILSYREDLNYKSFIMQIVNDIAIEKMPVNVKIIEKEINAFLEIMNDDPSIKIEILRYISKFINSNFKKRFDIIFNIKQYENAIWNEEFKLKLL